MKFSSFFNYFSWFARLSLFWVGRVGDMFIRVSAEGGRDVHAREVARVVQEGRRAVTARVVVTALAPANALGATYENPSNPSAGTGGAGGAFLSRLLPVPAKENIERSPRLDRRSVPLLFLTFAPVLPPGAAPPQCAVPGW